MKILSVRFIRSAISETQYPPPIYPEVAIFGRSNAGKSSLINSLVNRRGLAIVGQKPGRTQAINFYLVNEGLYVTDLPGYGYARVPEKVKVYWSNMVQRYFEERNNLKLVLFLSDIRREMDKEDLAWCGRFADLSLPFVIVLTKADKCKAHERQRIVREMTDLWSDRALGVIGFSIHDGLGKKALWMIIFQALKGSPLIHPARKGSV